MEEVRLDLFKPRSYQLPIFDALENKNYKRVVAILPRRAGKDMAGWNFMIRAALRKKGVYYYIFPTFTQAKRVIWDSMTNDGVRFRDYIPEALKESENSQEMKITLVNGSLIQLVGSDNYNALMGTNPRGVIFSEYALQDPRAYQFMKPILTANNGWALFLSTPRGKNHLWELYQIASYSSEWFCYKLTVDDTQHIPLHEIERERAEGIMSEDLIQQEYYTSFEMGVEGSYYAKYIDRMRLKGQIGIVPWEPAFKVHTAWDLGVRDSTTIIFFQTVGQTVRIIDCYEKNKEGLEHYVKVLQQKPYTYGKHIAPHDIKVKEFGSGMTRLEKARQLGIPFTVASDISIEDGIESVRSSFAKLWIDEQACSPLIKALGNYRQEFDVKKKIYKSNPLHDWSSHFCFAGDTLILTRNGMRPIMSLEDNDEVMTLKGWKPCLKAQMMRSNAEVVEVKFRDGMTVKCTPDHLFLTEIGWLSAGRLMQGQRIQSTWMRLRNTMKGAYTVCGRGKNIYHVAEEGCTGMCGDSPLEIYRKAVIFTIKTIIRPTIASPTLNAYQQPNIERFLVPEIKDFPRKLGRQLYYGMDLKKEDYGIECMLEEALHGLNGGERLEIASFVKSLMNASLEETDTNKNSAILTVKLPIIESVTPLSEKIDVWDITVPGIGHFSLENGAIVHNSDCMRYLCISLPKTRDGLGPEELDNRYKMAVYGENSNMPAVFRDDLPPY